MIWRRGRSYSQDLRERVFAASESGLRVGQIAKALYVSVSYVSKVLARRRAGETAARLQRCHVAGKLTDLHGAIREQVKARPDTTIEELQTWLRETHKVAVSARVIWKALAKLDLTLKKDFACRRAAPPGCCQGACRMARQSAQPAFRKADFHR